LGPAQNSNSFDHRQLFRHVEGQVVVNRWAASEVFPRFGENLFARFGDKVIKSFNKPEFADAAFDPI
jgi:hypothetical protein